MSRPSTAVAFFVYNRPELTRQVLEAIRAARPRRLLIVADGPKPDSQTDAARCARTRALLDDVSWDCRVSRCYAQQNLGCRVRLESGLDWVFDQVGEAVILEDDCLPHPSFFPFCDELIARFRTDKRVMAIGGNAFPGGLPDTATSYDFSRFGMAWGWASWRRAWRAHDPAMASWPHVKAEGLLQRVLTDPAIMSQWEELFDRVYRHEIDTWDYQWLYTRLIAGGLTVMPRRNLVTNLGHGADATHTLDPDSEFSLIPLSSMTFPLTHPVHALPSQSIDRRLARAPSPPLAVTSRLVRVLRSRLRLRSRVRRVVPRKRG